MLVGAVVQSELNAPTFSAALNAGAFAGQGKGLAFLVFFGRCYIGYLVEQVERPQHRRVDSDAR